MSARRSALVAAAGGALAPLVLSVDPGVVNGTRLLGTGTPDLWGHTVQYHLIAEALRGAVDLGCVPTLAPTGQAIWQADPVVPWLLAPVTWLAGAPAALLANLLLHSGLVAGALAWALTRFGLRPVLAAAAGLTAAMHPFTRGAIASSLPEILSLGFLPAFAWALWAGLRQDRRLLALAAVLGAAMVLDGLYAALPGALVGLGVLLASPLRKRATWAGAGAVAGFVGAAAGWAWSRYAAVGHGGITSSIAHPAPVIEDGSWVVAPRGVMDVLNLLAPAQLLPPPPAWALHRHTTYLGLSLCVLAAVGAWRSVAARLWLGVGLGCAILALGPRLMVAGRVLSTVTLPGAIAGWLGAQHSYRFAGVTMLALVAAAAVALRGRRARSQLAALALVSLEGFVLAPVERMASTDDPSGAVEQWLAGQEGAVLDLPLDRECERVRGPFPQRAFYQLAVHGRPIASGFCALSEITSVPTVAALDDWVLGAWVTGGYGGPIPPEAPVRGPAMRPRELTLPASGSQDRASLQAAGFAWVWVDRQALPPGMDVALDKALTQWLGAPVMQTERRWLYALER